MSALKTSARPLAKTAVKTAAAHLAAAVLCVIITHVYALFGHGVRSASMDLMFLYPLLGGTAVFFLLAAAPPRFSAKLRPISRAGYNLYNSGVAALTSAAMLTGIMEIAGTASKWIAYIRAAGYILAAAAFVCQWINRR